MLLAVPIPHWAGTRVYPAPGVGRRDGAVGRPYPPAGGGGTRVYPAPGMGRSVGAAGRPYPPAEGDSGVSGAGRSCKASTHLPQGSVQLVHIDSEHKSQGAGVPLLCTGCAIV